MSELDMKIEELKSNIKELELQIAQIGILKAQLNTLLEAQAILKGKQPQVYVHSAIHEHYAGTASATQVTIPEAIKRVLSAKSKPMHIRDLCKEISDIIGAPVKSASVASSIVKSMTKKQNIYIRTAPNTFGLKKFEDQYKQGGYLSELGFSAQ